MRRPLHEVLLDGAVPGTETHLNLSQIKGHHDTLKSELQEAEAKVSSLSTPLTLRRIADIKRRVAVEKRNREEADEAAVTPQVERRRRELQTMPHGDYLSTRYWRVKRIDAVKRAHFRCQICNCGGLLEVHHRSHARRGYFDEIEDLVALCGECHGIFHRSGKLKDPS